MLIKRPQALLSNSLLQIKSLINIKFSVLTETCLEMSYKLTIPFLAQIKYKKERKVYLLCLLKQSKTLYGFVY